MRMGCTFSSLDFVAKPRKDCSMDCEVNVGHLWSWAYRWEVLMKRKDAPTGYLIQINNRNDVRVGRAYDIRVNSWSYDQPT